MVPQISERPEAWTTDEGMRKRFEEGMTYGSFRLTAEKHRGLWDGLYEHLKIPPDARARVRELPGPRFVLVLAEDWCGDAASLVPVLARLADEAPELVRLRILRRDEHLDIMDQHLSHGGRSIPIALVYDEEWRKLGWWGPRPAPAQSLFRARIREYRAGKLSDKKEQVNKPILRWYREDRGRHTIDEFLNVLERGGGVRGSVIGYR